MKILVLTSTLPRWAGDTEPRFVLDLSKELGVNHEVLILAPHTPGAKTDDEIEGVKVKRYRYFPESWQSLAYEGGITAKLKQNPLRYFQIPFFIFMQWLTVCRLIDTYKPDVIHAHWIVPQGLVAVLASKGKVPVVCTSHGGDLYGLRHPLLTSLKKWVIKQCASVSVVSTSMQKELKRISPKTDSVVISMGANLKSKFTPLESDKARDRLSILFVGRLVPKKGLTYLIKIMPRLLERFPEIKLNVVGSGPLMDELQEDTYNNGVGGNVHFIGAIEQAQLTEYYRTSTLFIAPFVEGLDGDQEGLGLVLVEAAGCGCPIICGDVPAVTDVIKNGVTGMVVDVKNSALFESVISTLLQDNGRREYLSTNAREYVYEKFDWNIIAIKYESILEGACLSS